MDKPFSPPVARRRAISLSLVLVGLLLAGCAGNRYPTTPPDPRDPNLTWAERHYIQKMRYQEMTNDRLP
jgi:hypothetical protein